MDPTREVIKKTTFDATVEKLRFAYRGDEVHRRKRQKDSQRFNYTEKTASTKNKEGITVVE